MIWTIILLFVCNRVFSYDSIYSELVNRGGSCYPRDSCAPPRKDVDDHLWGNYTCECRIHCMWGSTCCADSPYLGTHLEFDEARGVCRKLSGFSHAVVLVSQCSQQVPHGAQIKQKCESISSHVEDPVAMAPVTSLATNVTYRNFFCALCNRDSENIYTWYTGFSFANKESTPRLSNLTEKEILTNLRYDRKQKTWGVANDYSFYELRTKYALPPCLRRTVKKCYPKMVNRCNPRYAYDRGLQKKCLAYYAPIKVKEDSGFIKRYRNVHCAICNNVNVSHLDHSICKLDTIGRKSSKPVFSFVLLLDINRSDGDFVGKKKVCKSDEKWDPFKKKCRRLACLLPDHVIKDGKCVPK